MDNEKITVYNKKLKLVLKRILLLQLIFLFLFLNISQAVSPAPEAPTPEDIINKFTGTWLYLWWHGNVSIGQADGKTEVRAIFIPESYGEDGDKKTDSFIRFRADGTGTFFSRHVMFTNKGKPLTVVAQDAKGSWIEKDVLASSYEFTWKIQENKLIIAGAKNGTHFNKSGKYQFAFNDLPTRPAVKEVQKRFGLKDEVVIYMFGQFLRLGEDAEKDLNKRYGIL